VIFDLKDILLKFNKSHPNIFYSISMDWGVYAKAVLWVGIGIGVCKGWASAIEFERVGIGYSVCKGWACLLHG
jgi:hypothetical protein